MAATRATHATLRQLAIAAVVLAVPVCAQNEIAMDKYKIGEELFSDKLDDQETFARNWVMQLAQRDPELESYAEIREGELHIHDPRGCTIWFKKKLSGPVLISYRIVATTKHNSGTDIVPRDINSFWMANSPLNPDPNAEGGLFDKKTFNGLFNTYHRMTGYYASTGGGSTRHNNLTTRFRRYPRVVDGQHVEHVALTDKDRTPGYQITPDKEHHVQLVAADDLVQYLFDGRVVYELKEGDEVPLHKGWSATKSKGQWNRKPWTIYTEGYFGLRSTHSHHVVSDFKVLRLVRK